MVPLTQCQLSLQWLYQLNSDIYYGFESLNVACGGKWRERYHVLEGHGRGRGSSITFPQKDTVWCDISDGESNEWD